MIKKRRCGIRLVLYMAMAFFLMSLPGCDPNGSGIDANNSRQYPAGCDIDAGDDPAYAETPNYEILFSEDVKRIDITIDSGMWQAMLADMTAKYGAFGTMPSFMRPSVYDNSEAEGLPQSDHSGSAEFASRQTPDHKAVSSGGERQHLDDENPIWVECTVRLNGKIWNHVGIRFKGQSSLQFPWYAGSYKLPFRLDFDQYEAIYPETLDQRCYGFQKLSLTNNWSDNSLIRHKVTSDIFIEAGVPASRSTFCRLFIDHGEGPKYFGIYTLVEIIDKPILKTRFANADGNLYEPAGGFTGPNTLSGATLARDLFSQEWFEKQTHAKEDDWSDLQALFDALHAEERTTRPELWREKIEKVFNVEGFLRYLSINTLVKNWDSYGNTAQNYYLYGEPQKKGGYRMHWIPWDFNMALMDYERYGLSPLPLALNPEDVTDKWPLIRFLMDDPVYRDAYITLIEKSINDGPFAVAKIKTRIKQAHDLITDFVVGNQAETPGYTLLSDPSAFEEEYGVLNALVEERQAAAKAFVQEMKSE